MSLNGFRREVEAALVRFLWRQWAQLGVSAAATRQDRWAQDPEALLLATLELGRGDARLFDEVVDWLGVNAGRLSLQRVKNLLAADPEYPRDVAAAVFAALAREDARFRWRLDVRPPARRRAEAIFGGSPSVPLSVADPAFLEMGLLRGLFRRSGKSREPVLASPMAFALRLREVFGVTARAEAVRVLLLHPNGELAGVDVARACAYAKRNVVEALQSLAAGGVVRHGTRGRMSLWSLDRSHWYAFLDLREEDAPTWVDWPSLLGGLQMLGRWLRGRDWAKMPAQVQASRAREVLAEIAPLLAAGAPWWRPPDRRTHLGEAFLPVFEESLRSVLLGLEDGEAAPDGKRRPARARTL